jgi:hypothetical protein
VSTEGFTQAGGLAVAVELVLVCVVVEEAHSGTFSGLSQNVVSGLYTNPLGHGTINPDGLPRQIR